MEAKFAEIKEEAEKMHWKAVGFFSGQVSFNLKSGKLYCGEGIYEVLPICTCVGNTAHMISQVLPLPEKVTKENYSSLRNFCYQVSAVTCFQVSGKFFYEVSSEPNSSTWFVIIKGINKPAKNALRSFAV